MEKIGALRTYPDVAEGRAVFMHELRAPMDVCLYCPFLHQNISEKDSIKAFAENELTKEMVVGIEATTNTFFLLMTFAA